MSRNAFVAVSAGGHVSCPRFGRRTNGKYAGFGQG
jgi:hypothetical protein